MVEDACLRVANLAKARKRRCCHNPCCLTFLIIEQPFPCRAMAPGACQSMTARSTCPRISCSKNSAWTKSYRHLDSNEEALISII